MTPEDRHRQLVRALVSASVLRGKTALMDVLNECDGADPRLVAELLTTCLAGGAVAVGQTAASFREADSNLPWKMPAADPHLAQWWFTLASIDWLSERIRSRMSALGSGAARVLAMGAPTVGYHLGLIGFETHVLDADQHVVEAIALPGYANFSAQTFDVLDELAPEHRGAFDAVILDPPWYEPAATEFLRQAIRSLKVGGFGFCSMAPVLTRPTSRDERDAYLTVLASSGASLTGLEPGRLGYLVPRFEEAAFSSLTGFAGRPWRHSDLLEFRKVAELALPSGTTGREPAVARYARNIAQFRVFQTIGQASSPQRTTIRSVQSYGENVSRRATGGTRVDVWTSEKVGVQVEDAGEATFILQGWANRQSMAEVAQSLALQAGAELETAQHILAVRRDHGPLVEVRIGSPTALKQGDTGGEGEGSQWLGHAGRDARTRWWKRRIPDRLPTRPRPDLVVSWSASPGQQDATVSC